ncbi:hypothetical protein GBAR_LOCUS4427 [Geodia barretti]|uniref:Uncharacterized protein n=1 Tax=Geodia barretti TaxID=519541 RepID=A0AA35W365_GEOBA|nr:hypothetical protein GBAR_LOCUS4427 [Geodia barretti]
MPISFTLLPLVILNTGAPLSPALGPAPSVTRARPTQITRITSSTTSLKVQVSNTLAFRPTDRQAVVRGTQYPCRNGDAVNQHVVVINVDEKPIGIMHDYDEAGTATMA